METIKHGYIGTPASFVTEVSHNSSSCAETSSMIRRTSISNLRQPSNDVTEISKEDGSKNDGICGKVISMNLSHKSSSWKTKMTSPDRAPPLPCTGVFRLQPRKTIPNLTSHSPSPSCSSSSRGRKRGAQTMVSTLGSVAVGLPKTHITATTFTAINSSDDRTNDESLQRIRGSCVADSPTLVNNAMQSMSIRSPTPSTSSLQENVFRDRESSSPFIVFSPSIRPCPYRQRPRSESFCTLDSSTKPPSTVVTAPMIAPTFGSPRRKTNGNNVHGNKSEILSTPRSQCHTINTSQAPATPASIRTLPSPHTTPLPRSIRLTPRSRPRRDDLSNEASIFLSPNEKLDHTPGGSEGTSIFSFEAGVECLEDARETTQTRSCSYIPSPFSRARTSVTSRTAQPVSSLVGESRAGSLRIETRSLLGAQDSMSTLEYIISSNARTAALDCDGSLSDDSDEPFVLANPTTLAQERDALTMPPPRPSRRRRTSPTLMPAFINAPTNRNDYEPSKNKIDDVIHVGRDVKLASGAETLSERDVPISCNGDNETDHTIDFSRKKSNSSYSSKYSSRLLPIESCSSLVGLGVSESSSSVMSSNQEPSTPAKKLDAFNGIDSTSRKSPSKATVRVSLSDADNVHQTIASMAVLHQQSSPSLMACNS